MGKTCLPTITVRINPVLKIPLNICDFRKKLTYMLIFSPLKLSGILKYFTVVVHCKIFL